MAEDIVFLDKLLEKTFIEVYNIARINCRSEEAATKIGTAIDGIVYFTDEYGQENVITLKRYRGLFIRLMHAEIYAALLANVISIDELFCLEFDKRITDDNYDEISTSYLIALIMHYIMAIQAKNSMKLSEEDLALVREICPWYEMGEKGNGRN